MSESEPVASAADQSELASDAVAPDTAAGDPEASEVGGNANRDSENLADTIGDAGGDPDSEAVSPTD